MTEERRASEPTKHSGHTKSFQSSMDVRKLVKVSKREAHTLDHSETVNKSARDESNKSKISESQYVVNYDHAGRDLKSAEAVKEELDDSTQSTGYEPDDGLLDTIHASPSPLKSTSTADDLNSDFFPSIGVSACSGSDYSFALQRLALKATSDRNSAASVTRFSAAGASAVEVTDDESLLAEVGDHEKLDHENSLGVPPICETEDLFKEATSLKFRVRRGLTIAIPSAIKESESSSVIISSSTVTQEFITLSKSMKCLQREECLTSSKYPDRIITRSASLRASFTHSSRASSSGQSDVRLPPRSLDSQTKARSVREQPATIPKTSWNSNERDIESKALTIWRSEREMGSKSSDVKRQPSPKGQERISNGISSSTDPPSREYATRKAAGGREGSSSSSSRSARDFSPSEYSSRRIVVFREESWPKPEFGIIKETSSVSVSEEHSRAEETDIELEARQSCLEKPRLQFMSEDHEHDVRPEPHEEQEIIVPFGRRSSERYSGEVEMETEREDSAIISDRPQRLPDAVESERDQRQRNAQQIYAGVWQCGLQSPAPLPRRSRFFMEAS